MADTTNNKFLPDHTVPQHYALSLTPDLEAHTFTGNVRIKVAHNAGAETIVLHAKELEISKAEYNGAAVSVAADAASEQTTLSVNGGFEGGVSGELYFEFTGVLNDQMAGFYRSKYTSADGEERWMAVTQFEATDARRAFPCFDEPRFKTTFDVELTVPANRVALSNMNVTSEVVSDGGATKTLTYATTPSMSSYLLAFVIGEFEYVEAATQIGSIPIRVYTPVGLTAQGEFALDVAVKVLDFYQAYYAKEYPLPKLDMVAIPDFAAGAMENWGLVTYRSVMLLYNAETTPASLKERIAYVVGHELAHQWFGNLVTMTSWTYLYLNEAFATYVGWAATHEFFPEWKVWESYVVGDFQRALDLDALLNSHPIEVAIDDPNKVDEIFDAISYCKGSAVLRMLVAYVGEDDFKAGMQAYVAKYAYANTTSEDLWACLSEASGKDVPAMMDVWVSQTGYPVVSVERTSPTSIKVSQARFLSAGPDAVPAGGAPWKIPLRIVTGDAPASVRDVVLEDESMEIEVPAGAWVKLNEGQIGFYRVAYDAESAALLSDAGALAALSAADRVGLVNDAFALAAAGYTATPLALDFITAVGRTESEYIVWADIAGSLGAVGKVWGDEAGLKRVVRTLFAPLAAKLGFEGGDDESYQTKQLRPLALGRAIKSGLDGVVADGKARFAAGSLHPDILASVARALFSVAEGADGDAMFAALVEQYTGASSQDTRVVMLSALGGAPNSELALKVMVWAAESGAVRNQDLFYIIGSLVGSSHGKMVVWEYVKEHFEELETRFAGAFLLARIVKMTVGAASTQAHLDDINAFFASRDKAAYDRPLKQALEEAEARVAWATRDGDAVVAWLANK